MNKNLVVFALFLILAGLAFNLYLVSLLGLIIVIPALASPKTQGPRPQAPPQGSAPAPAGPRAAPAAMNMPRHRTAGAPPTPPATETPPAAEPIGIEPQGFPPALFPNVLLPPLSQMGTFPTPQAAPEARGAKQEGKDDLVEAGTLLVLLKLLFG